MAFPVHGQKLPSVTPSRVADLICRKRYHTLHVLKQKPVELFSRSMTFGNAVHKVLKRAYAAERLTFPTMDEITEIVTQEFANLVYPDATEWEEDRERCERVVQTYIAQDNEDSCTLAVEDRGEMPVYNSDKTIAFRLEARFDRVLVRLNEPGTLVVRDYKTGRPGNFSRDAACIMMAIAQKKYTGFKKYLVEFDWLGLDGLQQGTTLYTEYVKPVWKDLQSDIARVYQAREFPAEPGEHCTFCPLRKTCQPEISVTLEEIDNFFA